MTQLEECRVDNSSSPRSLMSYFNKDSLVEFSHVSQENISSPR